MFQLSLLSQSVLRTWFLEVYLSPSEVGVLTWSSVTGTAVGCKTWKQGGNIWQGFISAATGDLAPAQQHQLSPSLHPTAFHSTKLNAVLKCSVLPLSLTAENILKLQRMWKRLEFIFFLPLCNHWWKAEEFQFLVRVKLICFLAFSWMSWTVLEFCANSHIQYHILNCTREKNQDTKRCS